MQRSSWSNESLCSCSATCPHPRRQSRAPTKGEEELTLISSTSDSCEALELWEDPDSDGEGDDGEADMVAWLAAVVLSCGAVQEQRWAQKKSSTPAFSKERRTRGGGDDDDGDDGSGAGQWYWIVVRTIQRTNRPDPVQSTTCCASCTSEDLRQARSPRSHPDLPW
jgi:hypothetical protein